eukprot:CAMPEP_0185785472 /NCGR_PEP_ID=MMETSP1174-20130828/129791_1 /TAXON_ID=35687 /ORGANISM="Dictyocha speculum, Strain CCMP1381" /LENGTH=90 /DNA_ID=CAMNT_0028477559 /DNA_START=12 /DNA_END=280 /DNA_ORIENTATION=+
MSTLVALSSFTGYIYSAYDLLKMTLQETTNQQESGGTMDMDMMDAPMFDMPAMLLTFIVLGKWLEAHAKDRTTTAITGLQALRPNTATLV